MGDIINVLSEAKFYNSKQLPLTLPLTLDEGKQLKIEDTKFYDINLADLGDLEKTTSTYYYIYGKLSPIINLTTSTKITPTPNVKTFDFRDKTNWNLLLLRPSSNDINELVFANKNTINFDNGLPLVQVNPIKINDYYRIGLNSVFGHDFSVGDFIDVVDSSGVLDSKIYTVVGVDGNTFYINKSTEITSVTSVVNDPNADLSSIVFKTFAKKLDNGLKRKYYIKTLRAVDVCYDFDLLGFSKNSFGWDVLEFSFDNIFNANYVDSMGYPIDKIYIGLVKTAETPNIEISDVTSKFNNLVQSTRDSDILEVISTKTVDETVSTVSKNDILLYGLASYNFDSFEENIINKVEHTFTINPNGTNINFSYLPFKEFAIRQRSQYIESSVKSIGSPSYAYYDEIREQYRWRDIYNPGVFDSNGNGINLPFMNGASYLYCDVVFNLKNYSTPKYALGYQNEVSTIETDNADAIKLFNQLNSSSTEDENTKFVKPRRNVC